MLDVTSYGAKGDGVTDCTVALGLAITAAQNQGGGVIAVPPGTYLISGRINLANTTGITLRGETVPVLGGKPNPGSFLKFTGAGLGQYVLCQSARGLALEGLHLEGTDTGFAGYMVDLRQTTSDTAMVRIKDCKFLSPPGALGAICLDGSHDIDIDHCSFTFGQVGIVGKLKNKPSGGSGYAIAVAIRRCNFGQQAVAAISNADEAWVIDNCVFEPLNNGKPCAYTHSPTFRGGGVTWIGNWFGDQTGAGTWIAWSGSGLNMSGNKVKLYNGATWVVFDENGCYGIHIAGNALESEVNPTGYAMDFGTTSLHTAVLIAGNGWNGLPAKPINGTVPAGIVQF